MNRIRGFTIIELLVTMMVLGIIVAIAAPSFSELMRRVRIDGNTSKFVNAINFARSEAATRGSNVTLCRTTDLATCDATGNDWSGGWLVFEDRDADSVFEDDNDAVICEAGVDDCLIRVWGDGFAGAGTLIEQSTPSILALSFDEESFVEDQTSRLFHLRMEGCGDDELQRIEVLPLGRVRITEDDC
jgi:type IV fimbrial biogenesis protein FimT